MNYQPPNAAPDAGSAMKFVASLLWRSKWLIGGAVIIASIVTFALSPADTGQIWTGRTTLTIGMAPPVDYVLQSFRPAMAAIEKPPGAVARISDSACPLLVVRHAAFQ